MFALINEGQKYTCKSTDVKETKNIKAGIDLYEIDTGITYYFDVDGTDWVPASTSSLVHTAVTAGAVSTVALAANASRKYAVLVNDSDKEVYIMVGETAVLNQGIRINPNGGSYEMAAVYRNLDLRVINAISSAADKKLLVTEGS